jgi:hypothetical protein
MEVVNTCGMVLENWRLAEVVVIGSCLEVWTVGKVVVKHSCLVEVMGTGKLEEETG